MASDVGGNAETVCENEQSLFVVDDSEEFERKMVNILTNEPANQRARAGQDCADTLLLSKSIEEYHDLYTKVAHRYE
jgi:glycosyltransferase involved in cell wall biosynthesis